MSQLQSSGEAPAASLVGSLGVFTLSDVLTLLAGTSQTGELQVVGSGVDGRLWLSAGELSNAHVGSATTIGEAVFELACVPEGWFYFTAGMASSSGQPTVPVAAVLDEVEPQVVDWRQLRALVPLESVVRLSPNPPGDDVQIRSDQWTVLTTIGSGGHTVRSLLDAIGGDHISGLRMLHELDSAGLVEFVADEGQAADTVPTLAPFAATTTAAPAAPEAVITPLAAVPPPAPAGEPTVLPGSNEPAGPAGGPPTAEMPLVSDQSGIAGLPGEPPAGSLAEVAMMPPPIAADPWTPMAEADEPDGDGVA